MEASQELITLILQGIWYVSTIIFIVSATFFGYHWLTYGTRRKTASLALAVYLIGGAPFLLTMGIVAFLM